MSENEKFDSWAVVELFGHQQIAGRVTEASIGGCSFLRVDVPDQPAMEARGYYSAAPALPAYTRYFGQGAIYALNPCTEGAARSVAARIRAQPPIAFDPQPVALIQPPSFEPDFDPEEEPDDISARGETK